MCGIAGIISSNTQLISKERIRSATNCLRHRGPENEGLWIDPENNIALGHSRLSIIDHSEAAAQPMQYLDRYSIVHNGELYNYIEIRDQLKEKGHQFLSNSDTEVIIAAYHEWGSNCLQQFDGMFAFAIWDQHERQLFAARDRLGEKPFFFSYDAQQFVFASEIKSLWNLGVDKEVNRGMLYNFLTIGYTTNPGDPLETFYQHISKLPAANYLRYAVPSKELVIEKY